MDELIDFVKETLLLSSVTPDSSIGKEWDSIRHLQLILAVEEKYRISIPAHLMGDLISVQSIYDFLKSSVKPSLGEKSNAS